MKKIPVMFLASILSFAGVVIAAGWTADPVVGTWKLNVAKSKFSDGQALKDGTRTYAQSSDGTLRVTLKSTGADGKETTLMRTLKEDGKSYPVNDSSGVDSISETRVSARIARYAEKKAGQVVLTGRRMLSSDGKKLTVTEKGTDPTGAKVEHTLVYDRQ